MRRNKTDRTQPPSLADLTWKTMDLVFWPLRESATLTRRLIEVGAERKRKQVDESPEPVAPESTAGVDAETTESEEASATDDEAKASTPDAQTDDETDASTTADEASDALEEVWGVGAARASKLRNHGVTTLRELAEADIETLTALPVVGAETAERIKKSAAALANQD